jgi:hypothetical protein
MIPQAWNAKQNTNVPTKVYQVSTGESFLCSGRGVLGTSSRQWRNPSPLTTVSEHILHVAPTPAFQDLLNTAETEKYDSTIIDFEAEIHFPGSRTSV